MRLPGFRPGKVPLRVLRHRFGRDMRERILERVIGEKAQQTCESHGITPAFTPTLTRSDEQVENGLAVTMRVVALPAVEPIDFASFELERLVVEVTDEAVESTIREYARNQALYKPIEEPRPVRKNDTVVVYCRVRREGEPVPQLDDRETRVTLTDEGGRPEWIEALVGAEIDETREFVLTLPSADEGGEGGDDVEVSATVRGIDIRIDVPVDDELARLMGCDDLAQLREVVRRGHASAYAERTHALFSIGLMDRLNEHATFAAPDFMVDGEYDTIRAQMRHGDDQGSPGADGRDAEREHAEHPVEQAAEGDAEPDPEEEGSAPEEQDPEIRAIAERRVKLGLLMREVGRQNNISVEEHELEPAIQAWVTRFPPEIRARMQEAAVKSPRVLEGIAAELYERKLVTFISELATVIETPVSVEELARREAEIEDAADRE